MYYSCGKFIENRYISPMEVVKKIIKTKLDTVQSSTTYLRTFLIKVERKPLKNPPLEEKTALPQFDMYFLEWSWLPAQC